MLERDLKRLFTVSKSSTHTIHWDLEQVFGDCVYVLLIECYSDVSAISTSMVVSLGTA
jgi:hypothetical protein